MNLQPSVLTNFLNPAVNPDLTLQHELQTKYMDRNDEVGPIKTQKDGFNRTKTGSSGQQIKPNQMVKPLELICYLIIVRSKKRNELWT